MSNHENEENGVNGTGTHQGEGVAPGRQGVPDPAPAGRHHTTGRINQRKWEKEVNKIVIECYIRSEPTKRGFRKRMKQIWDDIGVFDVTEQRLADQARQVRLNKWLTDLEMEEIGRKCLSPNNTGEDVIDGGNQVRGDEENNLPLAEDRTTISTEQGNMHNDVEMGRSFPEDQEIIIQRAEREGYDDGDKELLVNVLDSLRNHPTNYRQT